MMSLSGTHRETSSVKRHNPFTNERVEYYPRVIADEQSHAAVQVLSQYGALEQRFGEYLIELPDGMRLEVRVGTGDEAAMWYVTFHAYLSTLGMSAMQFLFDVATAGGMIIDGPDVAIATTPATKERCDFGELASSPEEVRVLIQEGRAAWKTISK